MQNTSRPRWAIPLSLFVGLFGIVTLKSGGEVLFIDGPGREAAGNYVPFVLWFNFFAGFAYVIGAVGLGVWRAWAKPLAITIAAATLLCYGAFGLHIALDGAYEMRTVGAMALRSIVWISVALALRKRF